MKKIFTLILVIFMVAIFVGCDKDEKKVVIASKPVTEQYILAEILTLLIEEHTDIKVEKKLGIGGGTSNIHPAMLKGEIDIYPEYTGTGWLFVLKEDLIADPNELYEAVKTKYKEEFGIQWLDIYGFNNTYALAVKNDIAKKYNLETYDDLAKVSNQLTFGAEYDFFEREDGYNGLKKVYGLNFKDTKEIDVGLKYEAIGNDQVDVINAFSTDGLLKEYDLKVLEDNKNFFPPYQAATLVREETLEKYPELRAVLDKLAGKISEEEMILLNFYVDKEKQDPEEVARDFLEEKGLI
ncbi:MAG: osmoprotectant transport system substrate-binding protein [Fusobacteria bacterium]|nr:MAG: osmoprotectant transport system substrate-binding protein [Fusobacteriota bacterium]KAF0228516.1 MAG: osmoprotectant transport system substrate-binding [Fusobacteriota bacterium]